MYEGIQSEIVNATRINEISDLSTMYLGRSDRAKSDKLRAEESFPYPKSLHSLPKLTSKTQRMHVGNGQYTSALFIIPVIIDVHGHRFEIYTLVSEIHENVDLVLGIKNVSELEGVINSRDCCFNF